VTTTKKREPLNDVFTRFRLSGFSFHCYSRPFLAQAQQLGEDEDEEVHAYC